MNTNNQNDNDQNSSDNTLTDIPYGENFVPYIDGDRILWAVYDAKSNDEQDGTNLFSKAIDAETEKNYISKERLEKLAEAYDAQCLFTSETDSAIERLQGCLGTDIDAEEFLSRFGFTNGAMHGFLVYDDNATPETAPQQKQKKADTQSDKANPVPVDESEEWADMDAARTLYSTLVFRDREIDNNLKGGIKEAISAGWCMYTSATNPTTVSIISTSCSAVIIGLMAYNTLKTPVQARNEALSIWAQYVSDLRDKTIDNKTAHENLKKNMHESPLTFEGVDKMPYSEFQKERERFEKLARHMGHFIPKKELKLEDINRVSHRLRNMNSTLCRKIRLTASEVKRYLKIGMIGGLKEVFTDLNFANQKTRKTISHGIARGTTITCSEMFNTDIKEKNKAIGIRHKKGKDALEQYRKSSEQIRSNVNVEDTAHHLKTIEKIKGINEDKFWAKTNFSISSVSMASQVGGVIWCAARGDVIGSLSNAYGIVTGVGAWAQTGVNVHNLDAVLQGEHAREAKQHDHVPRMLERLKENAERESKRNMNDEPATSDKHEHSL